MSVTATLEQWTSYAEAGGTCALGDVRSWLDGVARPDPEQRRVLAPFASLEDGDDDLPCPRVVHGRMTFLSTLQAPRWARRFVVERIDDGLLAQRMALLVSELVTNVVVHTTSHPVVELTLHPTLVVAVSDRSHEPAEPRSHPSLEGGRGLAIVAACADRWGTCASPGGKSVWVELDRS